MVKAAQASERVAKSAVTTSPEERTYLDLLRTTEQLSRAFDDLLKEADLSQTQYNVLRILRGAPDGLPCGEIGSKMITRDPDITRLLDRLERRELIARARAAKDRRVVVAHITEQGLHLLAALDQPVQNTHRRMLGHLGTERQKALSELLAVCRAGIKAE